MLGSALTPYFVTEGRTLIFLGKPGRGKPPGRRDGLPRDPERLRCFLHDGATLIDDLSAAFRDVQLAQALQTYAHPAVLVVDEVGYLTYGTDAANMLFHVVNERHPRHRAMIFTTNKTLKAWGRVLHDEDLGQAIIDRVLERGRLIRPDGPSIRTLHLKLDETLKDESDQEDEVVRISRITWPEFPEPTALTDCERLPFLLGIMSGAPTLVGNLRCRASDMYTMTREDWKLLVDQLGDGTCTAFLGAGASVPYIETGTAISLRWAKDGGFPLPDSSNLPRVAQYIALNIGARLWDPAIPKRKIIQYLATRPRPDYTNPNEVYSILAELPFRIVLTTNYDSFMTDAFRKKGKAPRRDFCRWNKRLATKHTRDPGKEPTEDAPLVYHLHGHDQIVDSLVLTEDDFVDFTVNVSQTPELIPSVVQDAITDNTLIFLGYSLNDWNFRVLFRTMQGYLENSTRGGHVAVLLLPETDAKGDPAWVERAILFFERYLQNQRIVVYWGSCVDFLSELRRQLAVHTLA